MKPDPPPVVMLSGIRWDFLWQRHQILATRFARAGYRTVFVETTGLSNPRLDGGTMRKVAARLRRSGGTGERRPEEPNLTVYSPLVAPPTWRAFRLLNRRIFLPRVARDIREITGEDPIVVAYPPTRTTLDLIPALRPRLLYYDCSEEYGGFPGIPKDVASTEGELLRRADIVSCTSPSLLDKVEPLRPDAFLSGPGVDYEQFATLQRGKPGRIMTVCYFGHLGRERIDFAALRAVAEAGFTVRLVGGVGKVDQRFFDAPGVDYVGEVSHRELPAALEGVDAFILPYLNNRLTRGISPAKTYECLATGRPVVASPLPALREIGDHLYLAGGPEKFVEILESLEGLETGEKVRARVDLARKNSWDARFEEIEEKLWDALSVGGPEERVEVLGVGVDPVTVEELHAEIGTLIRNGDHALVLNANVHCLNLSYTDAALRSFLNEAEVVFCDGAGVMLAARLLGRRIPERITYADWIWRLAAYAAAEGFSLYFLGARPGVAEKAAGKLEDRYPELDISGIHHGYFDMSSGGEQNEAVIKEINTVAPDILLVGFGMPLQERWLMENWSRIDARVALTGGAVFDYVSGELRRGPRILTDNGFEWLARLLVEPRRLWRRYVVGNPVFLWRVLRQRSGR